MLEDIHKIHQKPGIQTFFEIHVFRSKYLVLQLQSVKNLIFQNFRFEIPKISIEIQGF